ncbi:SAM-dependent methyltransferase [Nocardiopsis mwathae]|uniref:SAM-dependent methyltransferase n=1 Tax=Nocardiopsis mwathae TaxID=1472723 RepID=A0A7X0D7E0_9ACTN|nr:SAM-dependent methyltransferase [Nocardiopsis mwathae]
MTITETATAAATPPRTPLSRQDLVGTLFGAAAFQALSAGCELGLFTLLNERPGLSEDEVAAGLGLRPRPTRILLLATTALRLTELDGGRYRNAELIDAHFADGTWEIITDMTAFEAHIVYAAQADFTEALRADTNVGLRRFEGEGEDLYHRLAARPDLERLFYRCMRSWSRLSNPILVDKADLTGVRRVLDVGGGDGVNAIALARANPGVEFTVLDLPGAVAIAERKIAEAGLADRITVAAGDIFDDDYPRGHDCVLFANQLVIWSAEQNLRLLGKAHRALADGGRVLVFNAMADATKDGPLYAALDNLYFATIPAAQSTLYDWGTYERWLAEAGFSRVMRSPGEGWTPHGVISGVK